MFVGAAKSAAETFAEATAAILVAEVSTDSLKLLPSI